MKTWRRVVPALLVGAGCVSCAPDEGGAPPALTRAAASGPAVAGDGARYAYDGAGNLVQVAAPDPSDRVAVLDFSPRRGGPGELVAVFGAGFSPDPSGNAVELGGLAAAVVSATANELVFAVPAGATTGRIVVTRGGLSATSPLDFDVVTGVVVSGFAPRVGRPGTVLTITGNNFAPSPDAVAVFVGAGAATVGSASLTALTATVGRTATAGRVTVTSPAGTGTSADDFFLLPDGYTEWDVGFTARAAVGEETAVTLTDAGQAGLVLFDGIEGRYATLYVTDVTVRGATGITVHAPDGSTLHASSVRWGEARKLELPPLPRSGTYTIVVQPPPTSTGSLAIEVLEEVPVELAAGAPRSMALARGQNGRFLFPASAGDEVSFACTDLTTDPARETVSIAVYRPDGVYFAANAAGGPLGWPLPHQLPLAGTYAITIRPSGATGASLTCLVSPPSHGIVLVDGPPAQFERSVAGQTGRYSFTGTAGELLSLGIVGFAATPSTATVSYAVKRPDGTLLWSASATGTGSFALPPLPATGTYTLVVTPTGTAVATVTMLLSRPLTGTLSTDGAAAVFQTARVGQPGRFTFAGSAGQWLTMRATAGGLTAGSYRVKVAQPNGAQVAMTQLTPTARDAKLDLGQLPATGTYGVSIDPAGVATGQVTLVLLGGASDTLALADAPKTVTLGAAQNGRYTFDGAAGELLALGIPAVTTTPAGSAVSVRVSSPDGSTLWSGGTSSGTSVQLPSLPASGTYAITLAPAGTAAATVALLLSRPLTGALAGDGTALVHQTTRAGQPGRYTFQATAGQRYTLQATAGSFSGTMVVTVYPPTGGSIRSSQLSSGDDLKLDLGALPATGPYTVEVVPWGLANAPVTLRLVGLATDVLAAGDPPKTVSLGTAQNGRYAFSGTAGERLGLGLPVVSTTPAGHSVSVAVLRPDGATLWSDGGALPRSAQLPALPASGTYTLLVSPSGTSAASVTVLLSPELTGTLATDGTPTTYQTARPGQAGRYTFPGTAGQRFTLRGTLGDGLASYRVGLTVSSPTGTSIVSSQFPGGADSKVDLGALPATGTYTVTLTPVGVYTGSAGLRLHAYATDTLAAGGSARSFTLGPAQNGWYAFAGTAGASLDLVATGVTTVPGGGGVYLEVRRPDGGHLAGVTAYAKATLQLPRLPVTGEYGVLVRPSPLGGAAGSLQLVTR